MVCEAALHKSSHTIHSDDAVFELNGSWDMPKISRWIKDPFPGLSHFFGAILSIVGMIVLLEMSVGKPWWMVAFAIYGSSLILLYLASAAAHSIYCSPAVEKWLDRCDYMAIFLLIAGTYTPVCLIALRGPWGWSILAAEWTMAAIGIGLVLLRGGMSNTVRAILYVSMGWLAIIAAVPVLKWRGAVLDRCSGVCSRSPASLAGPLSRA
jgi:hemolysin III